MIAKDPSKGEIKKAIKTLKNNKAPGPDNIPADALKADIETSAQILYALFGKIWEVEEVPAEWKEGHIVKLKKKDIQASVTTTEALCCYQCMAKS